MAKKQTDEDGNTSKGSIKGNKKDGVWHVKDSHGGSGKESCRGTTVGSSGHRKGSNGDKPMIHVEPDNPWPRNK